MDMIIGADEEVRDDIGITDQAASKHINNFLTIGIFLDYIPFVAQLASLYILGKVEYIQGQDSYEKHEWAALKDAMERESGRIQQDDREVQLRYKSKEKEDTELVDAETQMRQINYISRQIQRKSTVRSTRTVTTTNVVYGNGSNTSPLIQQRYDD